MPFKKISFKAYQQAIICSPSDTNLLDWKSKDQQYKFILEIIHFLSMHLPCSKQKNVFFKNILIPRRQKTKSILALAVKEIFPEQQTKPIIHAKSFMEHKLDPNAKFKLLFESLSKPPTRNLFLFSQIYKKDVQEDRVRKRSSTDPATVPKINELIFRSEMQALARKRSLKTSAEPQALSETKFSFVHLRRSFRKSEHYRSSLLSLNHEAQLRKFEQHPSVSRSNSIKIEPAKSLPKNREHSLRVSQKANIKVLERGLTKKDEIRGWDTEGGHVRPASPAEFGAQY